MILQKVLELLRGLNSRMQLTEQNIEAILPRFTDPENLSEILRNILPRYQINTVNRLAGFSAQCGHESLDFTVLEENLNYSAEALHRVWPRHFSSVEFAQGY